MAGRGKGAQEGKLSYAALAAADRLGAPRPEILGALAAVWNLE